MDDIRQFGDRVLRDGLLEEVSAVGGRIGQPGAENDVLQANSGTSENEFTKLRNLLYDKTDPKKGLLARLSTVKEGALKTVQVAWDSCQNANKVISALHKFSEQPSVPHVLPESVQAAWLLLQKAQAHLEAAQSGPEKSIVALKTLLGYRIDGCIQQVRQRACALEDEYDVWGRKHEILENVHEIRRMDEFSKLKAAANEDFARYSNPMKLRDQRKGKTDKVYGYSDRTWKVRNHCPNVTDRLMKEVANVPPAIINGTNVEFPDISKLDQKIREDDMKESKLAAAMFDMSSPTVKHLKEHRAFFEVIGRQQAVMKALTGPDGVWCQEDAIETKYNPMIAFREYLDLTVELLRELEDIVVTFESKLLQAMLDLGRCLDLDFHDLHANLYYGDDEDRRDNMLAIQKAAIGWTAAFEELNKTTFKRIPAVIPRERLGQAEMFYSRDVASVGRKEAEWSRVISAIDVMDFGNQYKVSILAGRLDNNLPTVYVSPESLVYNARVRFLELPAANPRFDWGIVDLKGKDLSYDGNNHKNRKFRFRVPFKSRFKSKPTVCCWLNGFECSSERNYRLSVEVVEQETTEDVVTLLLGTWWSTELYSLSATWFAYDPTDPDTFLASGRHSFTKRGSHSSNDYGPFVQVDFPEGKFIHRPYVFAGISSIDQDCDFYLRFRVKVSNVSTRGLRLMGQAWDNTDNFASNATYLAFDDRFFK